MVSALLLVALLILGVKGISAKKDAQLLASQLTMRQEAPTVSSVTGVSSADMLRAKECIEAYALANGLPVQANVSGTTITITSANGGINDSPPETGADVGDVNGKPTVGGTKARPTEDKESTLSHFNNEKTGKGLLNFLSLIADMKYRLSFKNICIGTDCGAGIEMTVTCDGKIKPDAASPDATAQKGTNQGPAGVQVAAGTGP